MPRIATSSSMMASSSICCHCGDVDRARLEVLRQVAQVLDLARRQAGGAHLRRVRARAPRRAASEREALAVRATKRSQTDLRGLDRDLLADDRARQRGEGVAAALAAGRRRTAGSASSSPGRACDRCGRRRPRSRRWTGPARSAAVVALPRLRPSPRWCRRRSPAARCLRRPGSCGSRSARAKSPAFLAAARSSMRCGDGGLVDAVARLQVGARRLLQDAERRRPAP